MDLEDFLVSTILLPFGSLLYLLFCTRRAGWGFDNYLAEANTGKGLKMPRALRFYLTWVLPVLVAVLLAALTAGAGELQAGLAGLAAVAVYYFCLWLLRGRLRNEYIFNIKK